MKTKRFTLLVLGAALCLWANAAQAAVSDTFQISVTCSFLSINLRTYNDSGNYTVWAMGQRAENTATTMTEAEGIMVDNTSNTATDLSAWVSTQAAAWTNQAAAGVDQYRLEMRTFAATQASPDLTTGTFAITSTATPGNDIMTGLAATTDRWAYARFTTPTETTSGAQQTITVTILVATAS